MLRWSLIVLAVLLLCAVLWRVLGWWRWRRRPSGALGLVLTGALPDLPAGGGWRSFFRRTGGPDLPSLLDLLDIAAKDPKVGTLLVRIEHLECGLARAEEMRAALERFRATGKPVIVYADDLGLSGYWVALGASSIRLPPTGALNVSGVAMEFTLLEGVLDRAGIQAQLMARGKYKSMREQFTASRMSDANREMLTSLVTDLNAQLVERVAQARRKLPADVQAAIDSGPFRAEQALALGLIDQTQYSDELSDELGAEDGKLQSLAAYRARLRRRRIFPKRAARVALLNITGTIRSGHDRPGPNGPRATGHHSFRQVLRRMAKSPKIRAIVLRVDSPGGSALASDLMWRELSLAAKKKPMLVSMVNVAASGGYYTSALQGVPLWASPTTLTGSIGVVGGKFEVSGLLAKLGIGRETIASGPHANFYAATTRWTPEELEKVDRDIEAAYRDFVSKMAEARRLPYDELEKVAQGRVWTGRQAREASLVDELGGLWDVKTALRERLSLPKDAPIRWVAASAHRGLRPRRDDDLTNGAAGWLAAHLPGVSDAVELALDLRGEWLFALSLIRRNREGG
ncbi:MAG TPA: signal peptide peptidase SppA [Polyangiaceae bacterium]|nr:signal peptide peptidase SppA [Polyangiaceae bacterium]